MQSYTEASRLYRLYSAEHKTDIKSTKATLKIVHRDVTSFELYHECAQSRPNVFKLYDMSSEQKFTTATANVKSLTLAISNKVKIARLTASLRNADKNAQAYRLI